MGLSASQWNFGDITDRLHRIGLELNQLSMDKQSSARDTERISENYQRALSSKVMKWSNNSGITYSDISYNTFMKPGAANNNSPILLSDSSGKMILDEKYAKQAALISPDGAAGGDYSGDTRLQILSDLTGVPLETLKASESSSSSSDAKYEAMQKAYNAMKAFNPVDYNSDQIISNIFGTENNNTKVNTDNVSNFISTLKSKISAYITEEQMSAFNSACNGAASNIRSGNIEQEQKEFLAAAVSAFTNASSVPIYIDSKKNGTVDEYNKAKAVYDAAKAEYEASSTAGAAILNGTQDIQVAFYDQMFTAIAEFGWKQDENAGDSEYLNQMLQNNSYYLVTMTKNNSYDPTLPTNNQNYLYDYDTESAANYDNIFMVNDSDARAEALATYEHEKNKISKKEARIDQRMTNLETEKSALEAVKESIKEVKDNNVERTFNIFT